MDERLNGIASPLGFNKQSNYPDPHMQKWIFVSLEPQYRGPCFVHGEGWLHAQYWVRRIQMEILAVNGSEEKGIFVVEKSRTRTYGP